MHLSVINPFENALRLLEYLAYQEFSLRGSPKLQYLAAQLRHDLTARVDPEVVKKNYAIEYGELPHAHGQIRSAIRELPYELARWGMASTSYQLSAQEMSAVQPLPGPLGTLNFPHHAFAIELEQPIVDRDGNAFGTMLVNRTRFSWGMNIRLTVFSNNLPAVNTTQLNELWPNDLVRSLDIPQHMSHLDSGSLFEAIMDNYAKWPGIKRQVAQFWFNWVCVLYHVASTQTAPIFVQPMSQVQSVVVAEVMEEQVPVQQTQSLPPLALPVPQTPFDVHNVQAANDEPQAEHQGGQHVGREQRPTSRKGHWRRMPGQKGEQNPEKIWVEAYQTKREVVAMGFPVIGSRKMVG